MWAKIKAWLTTHSDFMNDVNFLATMGHIGWACLIMLSVALLSNLNMRSCEITTGIIVILTGIKEFGWDANFEKNPPQDFAMNLGDFCGYLGGIALAWGVILVHMRLH